MINQSAFEKIVTRVAELHNKPKTSVKFEAGVWSHNHKKDGEFDWSFEIAILVNNKGDYDVYRLKDTTLEGLYAKIERREILFRKF